MLDRLLSLDTIYDEKGLFYLMAEVYKLEQELKNRDDFIKDVQAMLKDALKKVKRDAGANNLEAVFEAGLVNKKLESFDDDLKSPSTRLI